ncbi:non-ribosomal peptide synthetase [Allostreptomyces psammosilenae]|uniref:Amino acid adenylation domain-containing protein/thioester reductase-like protein n=1 Tax=Allostreptomyces psammosilenae TaxID=1892865 RepID=A0A852ZWG9_9ACTN|nr:amino acid adenylation domain-containing protein [Allostreptomyces psammosilenae]NYI06027.1 amino acid adenylation domain-containing protein/thioester reductase-like protein [Allostreptomyces psammosilenae]
MTPHRPCPHSPSATTNANPDRAATPGPGKASRRPRYPRDRCLPELFEEQAAARPSAVAARHRRRDLSYGELSARSDALAARLRAAGVERGAMVGVCGSRSLDALIAFLGILKAGAAYVPLDDSHPPARLRAMAEDADVRVAVILPGSACRIRRLATRVELAALPDVTAAGPDRPGPHRGAPPPTSPPPSPPPPRPVRTAATDCAYVMFTSGSSGRPKPVALPHRGIVRLATGDTGGSRPTPDDRVLHAYGLSSDASTIEIWSALLGGARLVIADREELLSPPALHALLEAEGVTVAYLTTSVFHHVARTRPAALRGLRFVSAGGEAMDAHLTRVVRAACPDTTIVNFYGPTENSVVSTAHVVDELPADAVSVPIGRPIPHSTAYVVHPDGTATDIGEEGELLVGGDGLAIGYLGDPELTADRFVQRPRIAPRERLYRTGDRVLWRADGELEYRGRLDRQVKLRGHRIELDEVEALLRADPCVGEAVVEVAAAPGPDGGEDDPRGAGSDPDTGPGHRTLVGYVTPAPGLGPVPVEEVRQRLATWLPAPAIPARLVELPEFPVTSAGKVDRRRLAERLAGTPPRPHVPAQAGAPGGTPAAPPPGTPDALRARLAAIWDLVLRVSPAPTSDFFAIGGDSLLAAEVVTRTLTELEIDAAHGSTLVRALLRTPTLDGYTAAVRALRDAPAPPADASAVGPATAATAAAPPAGVETAAPPSAAATARRPAGAVPRQPAETDWERETLLGFDLPPATGPAPRPWAPAHALLTGASGFVGAFLLDRLLRETDARVHCPVRARDARHARRRVLAALARYGLEAPADDARLDCFPADLAAPRLALAPDHADALAGTLDLVVHSAAQVNFLYPYAALRPANVDGTREIIRLAAPRRVPVHFLSTIAVVAGFGTAGVRDVPEDLPLAHADRLTMGYAESKWVAERVLQRAADQGLPVAIHRPYEITGDRRHGACNTETAICSLFRTIAETGLAPDIPLPMDFVPVDHVAAAVVHLATRRPADRRVYHLTNPRPAMLADMVERMRAAGYRIATLPYREWVGELVRHVAENPTSPTAPFVSLCVDRGNKTDISVKEMYLDGIFPRLGRENVEADLAGSGLDCPPVDSALLDRYLEYFFTSGYLERPTGAAG